MDEKMSRMAEQLKRNPAMLQSLMRSQDGQTLMQMLTQGDQGADFQQAIQSAARGNVSQMTEMVNRIMKNPNGAALIERIQKAIQK